jgi:type II secretory ATPase GspE/PulE/Tfp pilus assembly ATPase PilB-like protein
MSTRTREELEGLFEAATTLQGLLNTYCKQRHAIDPQFPEYVTFEDFDEDGVDYEWEEYHCGCCGPDTHRGRISIDDLLDVDFEHARQELEERKRQAAAKAKADREAAAKAQERRERAQLAALQSKYGGAA